MQLSGFARRQSSAAQRIQWREVTSMDNSITDALYRLKELLYVDVSSLFTVDAQRGYRRCETRDGSGGGRRSHRGSRFAKQFLLLIQSVGTRKGHFGDEWKFLTKNYTKKMQGWLFLWTLKKGSIFNLFLEKTIPQYDRIVRFRTRVSIAALCTSAARVAYICFMFYILLSSISSG